MWHFYLSKDLPVPVGSRALCGHVAAEETYRHIRPGDERCPDCTHLLNHLSAVEAA